MAVMEWNTSTMRLSCANKQVQMLDVNSITWFRGNDCALAIGYKAKTAKQAIKDHVKPDYQETLGELLSRAAADRYHPARTTNGNDLRSKWISEYGLLQLLCVCKLPGAEPFQKWVFEEVLPTIRKTGSYSLPGAQQPDNATPEGWSQKRLEGIELTKLKNAALKQLVDGCFGGQGGEIYKIVNNIINQAVVGFSETTTLFKQKNGLPNYMSIPDFLDLNGQVARSYAENVFRQRIYDERERLQQLSMQALKSKMNAIGASLRQGFCGTGMGDLRTKMLPVKAARQHKRKFAEERKGNLLKAAPPQAAPADKRQKTLCFGTQSSGVRPG